jgi:hypothetical protein
VKRRSFLVGGMVGSVLVACRSWTRPTATPEQATPHELATIAAMADTFIPGGDGTPGALDCGALEVINDPAHGVNPYISEVVSDLDDWCRSTHRGRAFVELPPEEREVALEERMGLRGGVITSLYLPAYEGILALAKLAFFGAIVNKHGMNWVGFPGASKGYAAGSAAGAYAAADTPKQLARGAASTIQIAGAGTVTSVHLSALGSSGDDVKARVQVTAPDGKVHELAFAGEGGDPVLDDVALSVLGGPAAGTWKLEVLEVLGGSGQLELWSLRVRTDLDDNPVLGPSGGPA